MYTRSLTSQIWHIFQNTETPPNSAPCPVMNINFHFFLPGKGVTSSRDSKWRKKFGRMVHKIKIKITMTIGICDRYEWQADLSEGFLIYSYMYIYEEHTSSFHPSPSPAVTHWWKSALQFDVNWAVCSNIKTRISNLRSDHRYVYHNIYGIQEGDMCGMWKTIEISLYTKFKIHERDKVKGKN